MFGWFGQKAHLKKLNDILANAPKDPNEMTREQHRAFWIKVMIKKYGSRTYTTWNGQIAIRPDNHKPQKANWDPKAERRGMMYGAWKILQMHGRNRADEAEQARESFKSYSRNRN